MERGEYFLGGKEGSRGYLYQGFAAVLEALIQTGWDKIYVEFPTEGDKVDIALETNGCVIKAIQVKSTLNTFSKGNLIEWINALILDFPCKHYELFLIGQCAGSAQDFANAIKKFQNNIMDKKAVDALKGFDIASLKGASFTFKVLPFNLESLQAITRDALNCYLSETSYHLTFREISFIVDAMLTDQLLKSTQGEYTARHIFDKALEERIKLIARKNVPKRISLGIKSFSRGVEKMSQETAGMLDLSECFEKRNLRSGLSWHSDVYEPIISFLHDNTDQKRAYELTLDTHSSIAFAAGRILDTKAGVDVFPSQKTRTHGKILWDTNTADKCDYPNWIVKQIQLNFEFRDTAIILNVTHDITVEVEQYIIDQRLNIGKLIICSLGDSGASNLSVQNGTHAIKLANCVHEVLACRTILERRATLHIFASAPNALMFFLGQVSRGLGKCILYEYDFEQCDTCSYTPSFEFIA